MATEPTMDEVFDQIPETNTVTAAVIAAAKGAIGDKAVTVFLFPNPHSINTALRAVVPDKAARGALASAAFTYIRDNILVGGEATAAPTVAAPAMPTNITVTGPETLETMSRRRLLKTLFAEPDRYDEIMEVLAPKLANAMQKARNKVIVVNADGTPNLDETEKNLTLLARPHTAARDEWDGGLRIVTIERALGKTSDALLNPFTLLPQEGEVDGFDLATLDRVLLEAAHWARNSGHTMFPHEGDTFTRMTELFASSPRWTRIQRAYAAALEDDESVRPTVVFREQAPQSSGGPYVPGGVMPPFQGAPPLGRGQELPPRPWNPSGR